MKNALLLLLFLLLVVSRSRTAYRATDDSVQLLQSADKLSSQTLPVITFTVISPAQVIESMPLLERGSLEARDR